MDVQCDCGQTGGCPKCNSATIPVQQIPSFPSVQLIPMTPKGWECPKCGRIYAPACMECFTCNNLINAGYVTKVNIVT